MFVKCINENEIERAPRVLENGNSYIANPTHETLLEHGYKPLQETEPVGEPAEGYHYETRYIELADMVIKTWVEVANPTHEPDGEGGE